MKVEEEYEDVLMNIEVNLVTSYDDPEMTDAQALNAISGLIRTFKAEQKNRSAPKLKLSPLAEETFDRLYVFCSLLTGRDVPDAELAGDKRTVKKVYDILKDRKVTLDTQTWNRRYREYTQKIKTGSVLEIAKVIRDLSVLSSDKELSFGERRMLDTAEGLLVKELSIAKSSPEDDIKEELREIYEV